MKKRFIKNHGAAILSIVGSVGLVTTAVLTAMETPKALSLLIDAENKKEEELTTVEKAVVVTKAYIPAIAVGFGSIACILGANALNKKMQASLVSTYSIADQMYKGYRKKNIELYGEENDKAIMKEIARECGSYHVIGLDSPDAKVTWVDSISGRQFEAYEREIMDAEYHFNRNYTMRGCGCVNEWLEFLGLPPIKQGNELGWSMTQELYWVDFEHRLVINDDGSEVYFIDPVWSPWNNYEED